MTVSFLSSSSSSPLSLPPPLLCVCVGGGGSISDKSGNHSDESRIGDRKRGGVDTGNAIALIYLMDMCEP